MTEERDSTAEQQDVAEPDKEAATSRRSPGTILAQGRQARELSVREVANELHLTMHFVNALESDSYEKLPGDVFARGYIRSYAELLDMPPEEVLDAYRQHQERRQNRREQARERHARRRKDKNRPWIVVSSIAFIGVAVALWYFSGEAESGGLTDSPAREDAGTGAAAVEDTAPPAGTAGSAEQAGDASGGEEAVPGPDGMAWGESGKGWPRGSDTVETPGPALLQSAGDEPEGSADEDELKLEWQGEDELRIRLSAESWVEVEDGDQDNRYTQLLDSGDSLLVRGEAPFDVLLGNAPAARLQFNGRDIDIRSNVRQDNSAMLTIGL